jgi:hypothetical protein
MVLRQKMRFELEIGLEEPGISEDRRNALTNAFDFRV